MVAAERVSAARLMVDALRGLDRNPGQRRALSGLPALTVSGQDGLTTHPVQPSDLLTDRVSLS